MQTPDGYPSFQYSRLAVCATKHRSRRIHPKGPSADAYDCPPAAAHEENKQCSPIIARHTEPARATGAVVKKNSSPLLRSSGQTASTHH